MTTPKEHYEAAKYGRVWAVYCEPSRTYIFEGKGRKFCEQKAKELNEEVKSSNLLKDRV